MKVTVVPAQVTTVEDRIAGNLGFSQLMLLAMPVFTSAALFVVLPPFYKGSLYKTILISVLFVVSSILAIRIKGKLVLFWIMTLLTYNLRPRHFVFDKRTTAGRETYSTAMQFEDEPVTVKQEVLERSSLNLSPAELVALSDLMEHPDANLSFETKKGGLYVRISQVESQS